MTTLKAGKRIARHRYSPGYLNHDYVIVAAALADKSGVQVTVGGTRAFTDCVSRINLPAQTPDKKLSWGYLMHEIAHIKFTSQDVCKKAASHPLRNSIHGTIEDIFIEKEIRKDWPGAQGFLAHTASVVFKTGEPEVNKQSVTRDPARLLHDHILLRLRHDVLHQFDLGPLAKATEGVFCEVFPKPVVTRIRGLLMGAYDMESSEDALRLTDNILLIMKEEEKKQSEAQKQSGKSGQTAQGGGEGAGEDEPGDGDGEQGDGASGNNSQGKSGSSKNQSGDGDDEKADGEGNGKGDGDPGQGEQPGQQGPKSAGGDTQDGESDGSHGKGAGGGLGSEKEAEQHKALQDALNATDKDVAEDMYKALGDKLSDDAEKMPNNRDQVEYISPDMASDNNGSYSRLPAVEAASRPLSGQLVNLVQAERIARPRIMRRGQRLSGRHLHRVVINDMRIFTKREKERHPYTAVHLLIDRSGSMSQDLRLALDSAMALGLALETLHGVTLAVSCFPGYGTHMTRVLRHGERIRAKSGRFLLGSTGCTPMAEAMQCAAADLLQTREERKLLIVLTDGAPDNSATTMDMVDRCLATGIEVIGIGINQMSVQTLFPTWTVINNIGELRKALFDIARATLLKDNAA